MTHGEARKKIIEKIVKGEIKPSASKWSARADIPPASNEVFRAMLEVAKDGYGTLYGKRNCGWLKRRKWGLLNYLTILIFTIVGPRPSEVNVLQVKDFDLEEGTIHIYKADTIDGKPKADSEGLLPIPTNAIPILRDAFKTLKYREDDFVLSGKRDRLGTPMPRSVDQVERRFKQVARATAAKYPALKVDPKKIFPYIGRRKVSTLVTDVQKDSGLMASKILRHKISDRVPGSVAREFYIKPTLEEQRRALDKALAGILPDPPPPPPEDSPSQ